jgi:N-acetylglucosaminyldiphosphoundecaprenol N-acetyl-beta-D-mannosaminyltransferase
MIRNRINSEYPSLEVHAYSPPFKAEFSDEDNAHMASAINFIKPYALFVGMTAPKQEKWVLQNRNSLNTHCIFSIGAVFDFYSGKIKRPGIIWRSLGLEWLGRFLSEPKRLWRRSLISLPYFLSHVFKEAFLKRFR